MKRSELMNLLKELGCKNLCVDNKTLVVYNELQFWLKENYTPMKAISNIWVEKNCICVSLYGDNDFNTGFEVE